MNTAVSRKQKLDVKILSKFTSGKFPNTQALHSNVNKAAVRLGGWVRGRLVRGATSIEHSRPQSPRSTRCSEHRTELVSNLGARGGRGTVREPGENVITLLITEGYSGFGWDPIPPRGTIWNVTKNTLTYHRTFVRIIGP